MEKNEMLAKVKACKTIDEVETLMAGISRRQLSDNELDQVNGGGVDGIYGIDGHYYTEGEILTLGRTTAQTFGYDVAADMLCTLFMLSKTEIKKHNRSGADAVGGIDAFISQMFNIYDRIDETGHSY